MTRVLVLGGGSGGLVAANKVKRLLGKEVEVTLVDRDAHGAPVSPPRLPRGERLDRKSTRLNSSHLV